jgi:hypothetical protein
LVGQKVQFWKVNEGKIEWKYFFEDTELRIVFEFVDEKDHEDVPPGRSVWPR